MSSSVVSEPISSLNILTCSSSSQLWQKCSFTTHSPVFHRIHYCLASPQEIERWKLGEQQHVLGAEEGSQLRPHGFSYSVVMTTPELHTDCTHAFQPAQPLPWSRLVLVTSTLQPRRPHSVLSSLLQFIKVIALIASAYLSCVNMFMQAYYENVDRFQQLLPMFPPLMLQSTTETEKRKKIFGVSKWLNTFHC